MTTQARSIRTSNFGATNPDAVSEATATMFGGRVSIAAGAQTWQLAVTTADAGTFTISRVDLPVAHRFGVDGRDELVVETVRRGTIQIDDRKGEHRYGPGDVFLGNFPHADHHGRSLDGRFHLVTISGDLVRRVAGLPDGAPLPFASAAPVPGAGHRWQPVIELADELVADSTAAQAPLLVGSIGRVAAAAALDLFPDGVLIRTHTADSHDAHLATLHRAITFIEANPDADIGLVDIARAAAVTRRSVQLAFRRHRGTTPMAYLRRVRLDRARADLLAAAPGSETTVAIIAARWGYLRLATFNAHYQAAYGEAPTVTLRG